MSMEFVPRANQTAANTERHWAVSETGKLELVYYQR